MLVQATLTSVPTELNSKTLSSTLFKDSCSTGAVCRACNKFVKQARSAGYSNFMNHLVGKHKGYEDVARRCIRERRPVTMDMFVDQDARTTKQWMKLVVHKNFTLSDVDDEMVRDAVKFDNMCSKTLKARMAAAVQLMEPEIAAELKDEKFVLVFDGVTDACEHSLAVFAVTKVGARFLALSSFIDEQSMTADEHIRFLDLVLEQYGLLACNLVAIVCDNMETNKAISRRIDAPMIGCAAHRFNLAVRDYVSEHKDVIAKVATLMRKLKTVKRIALLKANGCKFKPVPMHELRWSGLHRMMKRYQELHPFLYLFERDQEIDRELPTDLPEDDARRLPILNFLPTAAEHCTIMELLDEMELFEVATKRLQSNELTIIGARDIFDEVLADFPTLQDRLKGDADIVESVDFERAVIKIMNGEEAKLTSAEGQATTRLRRFPITPVAPSVSSAKAKRGRTSKAKGTRKKRPASNEVSEPASKKPKRTAADLKAALVDRAKAREENKSAYEDLNWLPATSVVVERLFSTIKCTLGYLRKRMSADTLESILYLRMNWDLMTNEVLSRAIKNAREVDSDAEEESDSFA